MKWKALGKGLLKGLGIAAAVDPIHFGPVVPLIALAEKLGTSGAQKKQAVMDALEAEIALLPLDKQDEARAAYDAAVDAIVAALNAQDKAEDAIEKVTALIKAARN